MRRELGAELVPDDFEHYAFYNAAAGRVEMHLVAKRPSDIVLAGQRFHFQQGESLHTENSHKYSVEEFGALAGARGLAHRTCLAGPGSPVQFASSVCFKSSLKTNILTL